MEEPPPHVKFILCTTEPHKVPATIQSRCQRFEFRNIPAQQIADHLREVLAGEKVQAEDEVLWQVAGWAAARCGTRSRSWTACSPPGPTR